MSRRNVIAVSLILVVLGVWWLSSGDSPPPGRPGTTDDLAGGRERPPARRLGADGQAERRSLPAANEEPADADDAATADSAEAEPVDPLEELQETIKIAKEHPETSHRAYAVQDLGLGDDLKPIIPIIREISATDPDPGVQEAILGVMFRMGSDVPEDLMKKYLADPEKDVRIEAIDILENLLSEDGTPDFVKPMLLEALRDPEEEIRIKVGFIVEQNFPEDMPAEEEEEMAEGEG